jgi:hypothetical protein
MHVRWRRSPDLLWWQDLRWRHDSFTRRSRMDLLRKRRLLKLFGCLHLKSNEFLILDFPVNQLGEIDGIDSGLSFILKHHVNAFSHDRSVDFNDFGQSFFDN